MVHATRYFGTSRIAAKLHVAAGTVSKWIERYADTAAPFPAPDVEIEDRNGRVTSGWCPARWPEIEHWAAEARHTVRPPGNPQQRT
jgi:hypothetical protein